MHVCEDFREKIADQIIDRHDLADVELKRELLVCSACAVFYGESRDLMEAISEVHFDIAEEQWDAMADRMRIRILEEPPARSPILWFQRRGLVAAVAGLAAMLLVTFGVYRVSTPLVSERAGESRPEVNTPPVEVVTSNVALDPVTVQFLEQSELLLRSVMKLQPAAVDDLQEAQAQADRQLVALDQRKEAASEIPPVVNMMDKYEMILREIRKLNGQTGAEDITDIQHRIEKNGLIADMKAFQPKVIAVEGDRDENQ